MPNFDEVTPEQAITLRKLGLTEVHFAPFLAGKPVVYFLPTESAPGIGLLHYLELGVRLRSGVVEINDPGGGVMSLARFRSRSFAVAKAFGLNEVELFGAAIINARLEEILLLHRFEPRTVDCPTELGGGEMDILTRVFVVS